MINSIRLLGLNDKLNGSDDKLEGLQEKISTVQQRKTRYFIVEAHGGWQFPHYLSNRFSQKAFNQKIYYKY